MGGLGAVKICNNKCKGKPLPVTDRRGPQGCETSILPDFLDIQLTDCGKVLSVTRRPSLTRGRLLILIFVRGRLDPRDIVQLEELGQLKNQVTSSGIEPDTSRLVA
jgi:hypothetical protein